MTPSLTTWTWQYEDAEGSILAEPRSESFATRADAESWIGENWPLVTPLGVHRAQLLSAGAPVGRPLILRD